MINSNNSPETTLKNLLQRYVKLYLYSSNLNQIVSKLHKIIQNRGVSFGKVPSNESKGIIEPKWLK